MAGGAGGGEGLRATKWVPGAGSSSPAKPRCDFCRPLAEPFAPANARTDPAGPSPSRAEREAVCASWDEEEGGKRERKHEKSPSQELQQAEHYTHKHPTKFGAVQSVGNSSAAT